MRFWFLLAATMGPRFFGLFVVFFAIGAGLLLYAVLHA